MSWFVQNSPVRTAPTVGMTTGGLSPSESPFDSRIMQALQTAYPGRDQAFYDQQLAYFKQKNASGELMGNGQPATEDYWVQRALGQGAGGADVATAGPYAGAASGAPLQPYAGATSGLPSGYSLQGTTGGGPYPLASFSAPGLNAPFTAAMNVPTGTDDPGFQFALDQATKAIQRSAAAKGTLLTGGTLQDLANYTTGAALQNYDQTWNRARNQYLDAYGIYRGNQQNAVNNLSGVAGAGLTAAGPVGNLYTGQANANAAGTAAGQTSSNALFNGLAGAGASYFQQHPWFTKTPNPNGLPLAGAGGGVGYRAPGTLNFAYGTSG